MKVHEIILYIIDFLLLLFMNSVYFITKIFDAKQTEKIV